MLMPPSHVSGMGFRAIARLQQMTAESPKKEKSPPRYQIQSPRSHMASGIFVWLMFDTGVLPCAVLGDQGNPLPATKFRSLKSHGFGDFSMGGISFRLKILVNYVQARAISPKVRSLLPSVC